MTAADLLRVRAGDADLAVEVRGGGQGDAAILFVHGFPLDRTLWRHQLAALPRWTRIAPDLRGAGASSVPPPEGGYSMARYADDLVCVLDALGHHQAVVCGLSLGGYVVFELLRRCPDRVRAAVLCNTKAEADSVEAKRGRDELAAVARRDGAGAVAERLLPRLLAATTVAARPEVVAQVRDMIVRTPVAGLVGALGALRDRPDSTAMLATIRVPVLVVAGAGDHIAPPPGMRALARAIPRAQFVEIPDAGHLAPLEQPQATSRALADFLDGLH